jgi:hypothetical protein
MLCHHWFQFYLTIFCYVDPENQVVQGLSGTWQLLVFDDDDEDDDDGGGD